MAIDSADVILFVVDIRTGMTATDQDVASMLQRSGKPVVLCVNKCDSVGTPPPELYEFYNLGIGDPYLFLRYMVMVWAICWMLAMRIWILIKRTNMAMRISRWR